MKDPKDFWAGLLFLGVGVAAVVIVLAGGYELGSARKMGPGYFPAWLGGGLAVTGVLLAVKGVATQGAPLGPWALKPLLLVTLGTVLFAAMVNWAGLAPAIVTLVLTASFASVQFNLRWAVPLALALAIASVLVFVKGLGITVPVLPHVLGY
ncbi:MAG: tripartite tricarboxylate transporter TctB family protein [Hyphomicrobiaceae bacterium]|nr:tripartite tricarboxylate transporter TctB family protein [Hyphomicrobiaceae bacterium]